MFHVRVRCRPDLACEETAPSDDSWVPRRPVVHVFPYLCEQGSRGEQARASPEVSAVVPRLRGLFPDADLRQACESDEANMASSFAAFLGNSWPLLRAVNVIVTHGNFMRNELLGPAGMERSIVSNAAVLQVDVVKRGGRAKRLFLVRHCLSHHNACRRGSSKWTTCASLEAVRCLARRLVAGSDVLYGASALPRAIMSAVALQRDVTARELALAARAFGSDPATDREIDVYRLRQRCTTAPAQKSFCAGGEGTFILPPFEPDSSEKWSSLHPLNQSK